MVRGEFDLAQRLAEDLLRLSRQRNDSAGLVLGHFSSGRNLMFAGRFASSRSHLEDVFALYDPNSHRSLVHQVGIHPHVHSQAVLGIVLFCLGYPEAEDTIPELEQAGWEQRSPVASIIIRR